MMTSKQFEELGERMKRRMAHNISSYENWERSVLELNLPRINTVWLLEYYRVVFLKEDPSLGFFAAPLDDND